jgi:hypothetical protein
MVLAADRLPYGKVHVGFAQGTSVPAVKSFNGALAAKSFWKGLMKRIATLLVGLALMLVPSSAFAQSSQCQAYNPQLCTVSNQNEGTTSSSQGTLPFTGLDVALLAVGGGGLLGVGLVVRGLSRRMN